MGARRWFSAALAAAWLGLMGCAADEDSAIPDATLRVHRALSATPTAASLSYVETLARVHRSADEAAAAGASSADLVAILEQGVRVPIPEPLRAGDVRLESDIGVVRLELLARYCEQLLHEPDGAAIVQRELESLLAPTQSLPLDRASARALVALGHAAFENGDDALAVGSYSRAIRMMTILQQELVR